MLLSLGAAGAMLATVAVAAGAAAVKTPGSELCLAEDVEALHRRLLENGTGE